MNNSSIITLIIEKNDGKQIMNSLKSTNASCLFSQKFHF